MSRHVPIETALGYLYGRDCVFLHRLTFEDRTRMLVLVGNINGNLCTTRQPKRFVPYTLRFRGVLAVKMMELDSFGWDYESSFDEVHDSEWVHTLGGKVTPEHRHFFVQTYDDVFNVACEGYEFEIQEVAAEPDATSR